MEELPQNKPAVPPAVPKKKHWVLTVVILVIFVLVGLFAVRVIYLYDKILKGETGELGIDFQGGLSTSQAVSQPSNAAEVVDVLSEDDPALGTDTPALTVVMFADFGCPYCEDVSGTVRKLASLYGDRVRFVYRDFPLADIHPDAQRAAEAAECAHEQGMFWQYYDKLYANQDDHSIGALKLYALEIGADLEQFIDCVDSSKHRGEVLDDYADGVVAGVYGTPTFFFNGYRVEGAIPENVFVELIGLFL
ncbi:DsbA family protein [Patescibacteria group bacterium]|nr:DsbA family protein [Patescibacteria group bacterium]MBU1759135.1 DsbA family protein [Patescibacteria group bacterium]MBU1907272.1 DsbA family protein [Patescibacteria group bacterium]